jgi:hypothetical protein
MIDGLQCMEFANVDVIRDTGHRLICSIGARIVAVPSLRVLPGTTITRLGDRGRLILPRDVAMKLGLV